MVYIKPLDFSILYIFCFYFPLISMASSVTLPPPRPICHLASTPHHLCVWLSVFAFTIPLLSEMELCLDPITNLTASVHLGCGKQQNILFCKG